MSDILDEHAFQAKAPWGRETRVVPLEVAKEQQARAHESGMVLARAMPAPMDTITVNGHRYVHVAACCNDTL